MTCMGKNSPAKVTTKVRVMFLVSVRPLIGTEDASLAAIVILPTETYEQGIDPHLTPTQEEFCSL